MDLREQYGKYTAAEKEYWLGQAKAVKTLFAWGDTFAVQQYDTVIGIAFSSFIKKPPFEKRVPFV